MAEIVYLENGTKCESLSGASVAMGVYDGIHLGHVGIISQMCALANKGQSTGIITFDKDPDELFRPNDLRKLMSNEQRIEGLSKLPVDKVYVCRFNRNFAGLEPLDFLEQVFMPFTPQSIHVGEDFHFGKMGKGDLSLLKRWGEDHGMKAVGYQLIEICDHPVTATRIRKALARADVQLGATLLGRPYVLSGIVEKGRGDGASMGFATANLSVESMLLCLQEGVYGGVCTIDGIEYRCAISVGVSPTFRETATANIEVHIIGYEGELYGQGISVGILCYRRPMICFENIDELVLTVTSDIAWIRDCMPM